MLWSNLKSGKNLDIPPGMRWKDGRDMSQKQVESWLQARQLPHVSALDSNYDFCWLVHFETIHQGLRRLLCPELSR